VTTALLWAASHPDRVPEPPAKAIKAQHGQHALRARLAAEGHRPPTRDEKRLQRHYEAVLDAYEAQVVEVFRNR
jgi:hypothetical protein